MQKNLSKELFERISNLSDTLKLETIQLVNQTSDLKRSRDEENEDNLSDDSVIVIEGSQDVENNLFVKFIRDKQNILKEMKKEIEDNCEKNAYKVSLEDMINISVSLHVKIEDSIELLCNKLGMNKEEIEGFKTPLEDSVPVSLFQSNSREKAFNRKNNNSLMVKFEYQKHEKEKEVKHDKQIKEKIEEIQKIEEIKHMEEQNTVKEIKKLNLEVYELPGKTQGLKDINVTDLNNLGLSEETRKLLGLE